MMPNDKAPRESNIKEFIGITSRHDIHITDRLAITIIERAGKMRVMIDGDEYVKKNITEAIEILEGKETSSINPVGMKDTFYNKEREEKHDGRKRQGDKADDRGDNSTREADDQS